jgi:2-polyprenyl-3-methyl-5-hydroxy-6-metoxy-1,4-benzoquinol methylase
MNRRDRRAGLKEGRASAAAGQASPAGQLLAQAFQAMQRGDLGLAEGIGREVVLREPKNAAGHYLLGSIAMQAGRPDLALEPLRKACDLERRNGPYHNELGLALQAVGLLDEAVASYRRAIALEPENGRGYNNLAVALQAKGLTVEAGVQFAKAIVLSDDLLRNYAAVLETLYVLNPAIRTACQRADAAWPRRLTIAEMFDAADFAAVAVDPLLHCLLVSASVRDRAMERMLTGLRADLLVSAMQADSATKDTLALRCALARQCFINEYVFAVADEETTAADRLGQSLTAALAAKSPVAGAAVAAFASYRALAEISEAPALIDRGHYPRWPAEVDALLREQLREPMEERQLRSAMQVLTPIEDETSRKVRAQYEENPYPRWFLQPVKHKKITIEDHLRMFSPTFSQVVSASDKLDVLVAGCGTGYHAIVVARAYKGARVLAVDLSLASLAYAERKARELGVTIAFAQADILKLDQIGRDFDLIEASGVLHHLADPEAGWRKLLSLLRPNGVMKLGLYSELARRDIVAAREFIAARGFPATAEGIRAARAAIVDSDLRAVTRFNDFYATSECRDLLFHVQEQRFTIARIRAFLEANDLRFVGFEAPPAVLAAYARRFPDDWTLRELSHWEQFESEWPATFEGMYQFCIARR